MSFIAINFRYEQTPEGYKYRKTNPVERKIVQHCLNGKVVDHCGEVWETAPNTLTDSPNCKVMAVR